MKASTHLPGWMRTQQPQLRSTRRLPLQSSHSSNRRGHLACHASVVWRQLERSKTWLAHPRAARTRGLVHFLGGAFAGAAPQLLYNAFIEGLAEAGYTVVATPYAVTFRHDACARQVRQAFLDSLAELRASGRGYLAPPACPQYGVGHSNGALLHLLISSYEPGAADANVIVSYNNLQVSDAIPIPGFLDSLQPTVQAARAANTATTTTSTGSSALPGASAATAAGSSTSSSSSTAGADSAGQLAAAAAALPLSEQQALLLAGAGPALDQLSSIVNEVGDGLTDFSPSPEESRAIIRAGYACPATLLLQFENDNFDETPEMQQLLAARLEAGSTSASTGTGSTAGGNGDSGVGDDGSSSSSSSGAVAGGDMPPPPGPAASGYTSSGYTSAWSSMDEDVSKDALLQQLQQLQAALQQQEQQQQQQPPQGRQVPLLQRQLLQGSHVTPCGAALPSGLLAVPGPFGAVLESSSSRPGSQAEQQQLIARVVAFLDARRQPAVARRAAKQRAGASAAAAAAPAVGAGAAAAAAAGGGDVGDGGAGGPSGEVGVVAEQAASTTTGVTVSG